MLAPVTVPEPPETPEQFGDAQWVKVFKTQLPREVTLDELVSDNAVVPQDATQVEVAWEIL
ncbi:MAG: PEP-CTERM sorting domain-containing protein, partial [Acidobacteriota bacterium]|nr:PEP-CTERM sorting domain-containing protein [Acidobacteriota bacterium]